ncbi:hypothetical protein RHECNPAF_1740038 [Rhizobium etli CNPAF512]|nr:hypothetical protein RHECNPAF_1740038 [Rhizobium etli CNPAF512]
MMWKSVSAGAPRRCAIPGIRWTASVGGNGSVIFTPSGSSHRE